MNENPSEVTINILINGKKYENLFRITISDSINSLKRLKDKVLSYISTYLSIKTPSNSDKIRVFNYKGIEIDNADIDYLYEDQFLFISLDGSSFSISNYINEYQTVSLIKSGGYGKVFLCKHVITGKQVAIKQNDIADLSNDEIYNISREALYLESMKHKNVVKYINSYTNDKCFYTIMQYAEGGELQSYILENKWISERKSKKIFSQMTDAIKYIHSKNIIHRDLKPNNILFSDSNKECILIIDFGISGYSFGNIHEKIKAGTVKFSPPEIAGCVNFNSSAKLDIWSMGVILYFMLFGILPFEGESESEIINKILNEEVAYPSNIPLSKACRLLLQGLLEKNPELRIDLNSDLIEDWINDPCLVKYHMKNEYVDDINIDDLSQFEKMIIKEEAVFPQIDKDEKGSPFKNRNKSKTMTLTGMMNHCNIKNISEKKNSSVVKGGYISPVKSPDKKRSKVSKG